MFYLKYRPRTISELDNTAPRQTISSILSNKSLPHAFLFIGQKGTGKTSTARIFAKSINCKSRKGIEPCNVCNSCRSIDNSSFPDVVEMDAASNRGINEIKELIKESSLLPLMGGYRVYIIDEAHMITNDGFNALLKTLEEPPETVIFILATTNLEKVPKTIQSRCVLVQFGSAKISEIVHMLERIKTHEKITVDPKVLSLIAQYSDNSFRDAAKIFEELVISNNLSYESVEKHIGIRSKHALFESLQKKDSKSALTWVQDFAESGGSISHLMEGLLSDLQNHLLFLHGIPGTESTLTLDLKNTIKLMRLLNEAYGLLKLSPIPTIPLHVALVDYLT